MQEGAWSLYISVQNHNTQPGTGKYIYTFLTLDGKQHLLKSHHSQSHLTAAYHYNNCLPDKEILLKIPSHS